VLYALFVEQFKLQKGKKQNFFEFIDKFMKEDDDDTSQRATVGLECGFNFSLSLLKEIKNLNPLMLEQSLEYLYQTLKNAKPSSLFSTDRLSFMIDSNLNDARDFL
jgi:hypothetical protein